VLLALLARPQVKAWCGTRAVLRPVLPADHAEAGLPVRYALIGLSLIIGTSFFIVFGWLSDRIGRLKIILAGCAIAAVTYFPLFAGLTHFVNPTSRRSRKRTRSRSLPTSRPATSIFVGPWSTFRSATAPRTSSTKSGLSFKVERAGAKSVDMTIGSTEGRSGR
jgi:MFS family permease